MFLHCPSNKSAPFRDGVSMDSYAPPPPTYCSLPIRLLQAWIPAVLGEISPPRRSPHQHQQQPLRSAECRVQASPAIFSSASASASPSPSAQVQA